MVDFMKGYKYQVTPPFSAESTDFSQKSESLVYAREHPRPVVAGAVGGALAIGALVGLRNKSAFREGTPTWMRWTATGLIAATALAVGVYGTEFIYQLSENR